MLYGISIISSKDKTKCEYKLGAFVCISLAEFELRTDFFSKNLCKNHVEEYKNVLSNENNCFDESVIHIINEENDL
ncbi:MAG: hypothetical protein OEV44_06860 [Spirochaetota bacterium]|nr:hypothetical protein [Spirochaetota bacterium]